MKEQRIVIELDGEGHISADAEGFAGELCLKDLEQLLEGLGGPRERVDRKPDAAGAGVSPRRGITVGSGKKP